MNDSIETKIDKINDYFYSNNRDFSEKEHVYPRVIKLNEEVGELCEAVLYEYGKHQRDKNKKIDLDSELADVIIVALMIAKVRSTDIWQIVDQKLAEQVIRFELE